jgi:hypothetical protein
MGRKQPQNAGFEPNLAVLERYSTKFSADLPNQTGRLSQNNRGRSADYQG